MITLLTAFLLHHFDAAPVWWDCFFGIIALRVFLFGVGVIIGIFGETGGAK
jgi:hypothetical protein